MSCVSLLVSLYVALFLPDGNQPPKGAFRREVLLRAHAALDDPAAATDDCVALERIGEPVRLIPGDTDNRKLTFPEDRELLALALQSFSQEAASTP